MKTKFIYGDCITVLSKCPIHFGMSIIDPIYGEEQHINAVIKAVKRVCKGPILCFMFPEDIQYIDEPIDQILHWIKPESTKNTKNRYSRFVEAIALFQSNMITNSHWSNRTGIFTDRLLSNEEHPWKKPESLIERLIRNHYTEGIILDPCAGSGTTARVCKKMSISSVSIEIKDTWTEIHNALS